MIHNYCRPCGETLCPEDTVCPFCGQPTVPVDEIGYASGVLAALDGMDLPDGAYFGMADELGIEP